MIRIEQMEIPLPCIRSIQLSFDRHSISLILSDVTFPAVFKLTFILKDQITDKGIHSLYHDHKIIAAAVHVPDVFLTEISSVENESHMPVPIAAGFFQHELQLGYIDYAPRILLVKQGFSVVCIISDGVIEYRKILVILCMPELHHLYAAGLTVLVCGIIRNINLFPMVTVCIPFI